jgi:high-affinity iron transporter
MFSTAIVIFRESLEISLILGIVIAATRGLQDRLRWIFAGLGAGAVGAGLVAFFAGEISSAASGAGQEYFNAGILFAAALCIGWTALWMRRHVREMTAEIKKVGAEVLAGRLPHYSLSAIIALAMLREGSEIVLFVYGMFVSGETGASIAAGSALGFALGALTGVAFYYGIIKMSARYMLQVTSWILMLLVAGLAAQGVGFLQAAGWFDMLSKPVWDTSWLLSDRSLAGKALHSLVGYSARPSEIQLAVYAASLATLMALIAVVDGRLKRGTLAVSAAAAGLVILGVSSITMAFAQGVL